MARAVRTQSTPRRLPRQPRARVTVDAIVEAASRILATDGYERTNVNRVATLAGVSVGSLYQYFPTKLALAGAVASRLSARMLEAFGHDIGDIGLLPLPVAIREIVVRAFEAFRIDPRLRRVIREEVPEVGAAFRTPEFDETLRGSIVGYLEQHRTRVRPRDLDLAARILMSSVEAVAERWSGDATVDEDALVAETSELVLRYVVRDPGA